MLPCKYHKCKKYLINQLYIVLAMFYCTGYVWFYSCRMKALRWADVTKARGVVPLHLCGCILGVNVSFLPPGKKR